jgi:SulP family sulfate permease
VGDARWAVVILRLRVYDEIGSTFLRVIEQYALKLNASEGRLMLTGISPRFLDQLEKTGLAGTIGRDNIFPAQPRFGEALFIALEKARQFQGSIHTSEKAGKHAE